MESTYIEQLGTCDEGTARARGSHCHLLGPRIQEGHVPHMQCVADKDNGHRQAVDSVEGKAQVTCTV
jgi:hypothetical protein